MEALKRQPYEAAEHIEAERLDYISALAYAVPLGSLGQPDRVTLMPSPISGQVLKPARAVKVWSIERQMFLTLTCAKIRTAWGGTALAVLHGAQMTGKQTTLFDRGAGH